MANVDSISYRVWSRDRPVSSGYYWCTRDSHIFMMLVYWDEEHPQEPLVRMLCDHCDATPMSHMDENFQWFGPLGPPMIDAAIYPDGSYTKLSSALDDDEDGAATIE